MNRKQYLFPGCLAFLAYNILSASNACASSGFTYEEKTDLVSLIWITFCSAIITINVFLRHYWQSKVEEWSIIWNSTSTASLIAFACFGVSLVPLMHRIAVPDAMFVVYLPAVTLAFLTMATALWVRTLTSEQPLTVAAVMEFVENPGEEWAALKKKAHVWMRERKIEKRRKYWQKREKEREREMIQRRKKRR